MADEGGGSRPADAAFAGLSAVEGCSGLSADQLAALATVAIPGDLEPGAPLYDEGESTRDLFVLLSGEVTARRTTPLGLVRLALLQAGALAGEPSFLDGHPREATLTAVRPTSFLLLPLGATVTLMEADEGLAMAILRLLWRSLTVRLRQANGEMLRIMGSSAPLGGSPADLRASRTTASQAEKLDVLLGTGLTAKGLDLLAESMRSERFAAGEVIVSEGSPGEVLYVVAEGQARVSRQVPGMGEEALLFVGRGGVFGEMAFVDGASRSADVRAHDGECVVLSINRSRLDGFLTEHPNAASQLLDLVCQTLCNRLRSMGNQLVAWRIMAGFGETD